MRDERRDRAIRRLCSLRESGRSRIANVRQRAHPGDRTVGELAAEPKPSRPQGGCQDGHRRRRRDLSGSADLFTVEIHLARFKQRAQNGQALTQVRLWPVKGDPEKAMDDRLMTGADPQAQPSNLTFLGPRDPGHP